MPGLVKSFAQMFLWQPPHDSSATIDTGIVKIGSNVVVTRAADTFVSVSSTMKEPQVLRDTLMVYLCENASTENQFGSNSTVSKMKEWIAYAISRGCRVESEEPTGGIVAGTAMPLGQVVDPSESIENIFRFAKSEVFEDGMESSFSKELIAIVLKYGKSAMIEVARLITEERVDVEAASEALKWLGQLRHHETHAFRLWLLKRGLSCSSIQVRDGALLGLSFLGDRDAISSLQNAIERERIASLREDMRQVLLQLQGSS